jgi:hypothetical protein
MSSTHITSSSARVTQVGANTGPLLIFYVNNEDAAVTRYQERSTSEAEFSDELGVVVIFEIQPSPLHSIT